MAVSKNGFRAGLLGAAALAALGVMPSGPAHAGALATSIVNVQSLLLGTVSGTTFSYLTGSQANDISVTTGNTSVYTATTNNTVFDGNGVPTVAGTNVITSQVDASGNGTADPVEQCVGPSCSGPDSPYGQNDFTTLPSFPPVTGVRSSADAFMTGSVFATSGAGLTDQTRADVAIAGGTHNGTNSVTSGANANLSLTFQSTSDLSGLSFILSGNDDLISDVFGPGFGNASASASWTLVLTDLGADGVANTSDDSTVVNFDFNTRLNELMAGNWHNPNTQSQADNMADTSGGCPAGVAGAGFVNVGGSCYVVIGGNSNPALLDGQGGTFSLVAGRNYSFAIGHTTTASAQFVPEPMSLALLGSGLFGFGIIRRKVAKKKS